MRDLVDLAQIEAEKEYNVYRTDEGKTQGVMSLDFGTVVLSPEMLDSARRPNRYQWSVVEESKLPVAQS